MHKNLDDHDKAAEFSDTLCNISERMYIREQIEELEELLKREANPASRSILEWKINKLKCKL